MADFKTMYHKMFNTVTDAEHMLQQVTAMLQSAQQECEEIFMEADDTPISLTDPSK